MVVVDARGDMDSGIFGEMMLTYFAGLGGEGVVIDGCIRDSRQGTRSRRRPLGPRRDAQFPCADEHLSLSPSTCPIACANTFVMPGDIIVADDDGAVVVPVAMAEQVIEVGGKHAEWEEFSRARSVPGRGSAKILPSARRCRSRISRLENAGRLNRNPRIQGSGRWSSGHLGHDDQPLHFAPKVGLQELVVVADGYAAVGIALGA